MIIPEHPRCRCTINHEPVRRGYQVVARITDEMMFQLGGAHEDRRLMAEIENRIRTERPFVDFTVARDENRAVWEYTIHGFIDGELGKDKLGAVPPA